MAKRRTKKQKRKAKENYTVSWNPSSPALGSIRNDKNVDKDPIAKKTSGKALKDTNNAEIKRDIFKSLLLASLVIGLELVLYFAWQN